jgi:DNA replication protein DnaC
VFSSAPRGSEKRILPMPSGSSRACGGYRVLFTTAADLVNDLVAAQARNGLHRRLAFWSVPDLLLVDELGYLSFDARGADLLYQVFNRYYTRTNHPEPRAPRLTRNPRP